MEGIDVESHQQAVLTDNGQHMVAGFVVFAHKEWKLWESSFRVPKALQGQTFSSAASKGGIVGQPVVNQKNGPVYEGKVQIVYPATDKERSPRLAAIKME